VTEWGPDLFVLDKASSVPIYVQLAERVRTLITVGTLVAGDKLPSIRSVAEALRVDYNTVARAYTELDRDGIIRTARGIGTHVTGEVDEAALAESRRENLHSTIETVVGELVNLGYTPEEIQSAFHDTLSRQG